MGFFSWRTQDTDRSICNTYSSRTPFRVVMTDNKGNKWIEDDYEGYGEFGGKDFYELVAEMNGFESNRSKGIDIVFGIDPYLSPNLTENEDHVWINEAPERCENQGYFYDDNEDEIF